MSIYYCGNKSESLNNALSHLNFLINRLCMLKNNNEIQVSEIKLDNLIEKCLELVKEIEQLFVNIHVVGGYGKGGTTFINALKWYISLHPIDFSDVAIRIIESKIESHLLGTTETLLNNLITIYLIPSTSCFRMFDEDFCRSVLKNCTQVFFVLTKYDLIKKSDRNAVIEYFEYVLSHYLNNEIGDQHNEGLYNKRVFPVSSILAVEALCGISFGLMENEYEFLDSAERQKRLKNSFFESFMSELRTSIMQYTMSIIPKCDDLFVKLYNIDSQIKRHVSIF